MTVLDLSGYDALLDSAPTWDWGYIGWPLMMAGIILFGASVTDCVDDMLLAGVGAFCMIIVGLFLTFGLPHPDTPSFASYVGEAYGFSSSSLPDDKPKDGSLPVTWKKDGEIHSGTLSLLDDEVSIKETNGDYLEVEQ